MHDLPPGTTSVELPGIYDRRWYSPSHGDVYVLSFEGVDVGQAVLGESVIYKVYLPLMMGGGEETQCCAVRIPHISH